MSMQTVHTLCQATGEFFTWANALWSLLFWLRTVVGVRLLVRAPYVGAVQKRLFPSFFLVLRSTDICHLSDLIVAWCALDWSCFLQGEFGADCVTPQPHYSHAPESVGTVPVALDASRSAHGTVKGSGEKKPEESGGSGLKAAVVGSGTGSSWKKS